MSDPDELVQVEVCENCYLKWPTGSGDRKGGFWTHTTAPAKDFPNRKVHAKKWIGDVWSIPRGDAEKIIARGKASGRPSIRILK